MDSPEVKPSQPDAAVTASASAAEVLKLPPGVRETAFGCPRDFHDRRFVYTVVSPRARGLSVGVNMNPDKRCNLDCVYCEVDRTRPARESRLDVEAMADELQAVLEDVHAGRLQSRPAYANLPRELLALRHVALSGDGEPTLCPNFAAAVETVVHARARGRFPFFKIVLITNGSGLDLPAVRASFDLFTQRDEIWVKLDVGRPEYFQRINRPEAGVTLDKILANILAVGRERPVVIQSLFPLVEGREAPLREIEECSRRLGELRNAGSRISLVQVYSATRPVAGHGCGHLPLRSLSAIAQAVRSTTGLPVEVY